MTITSKNARTMTPAKGRNARATRPRRIRTDGNADARSGPRLRRGHPGPRDVRRRPHTGIAQHPPRGPRLVVRRPAARPDDRGLLRRRSTAACPYWAAMELAQEGFCAKHLNGGLAQWRKNGYPIESTPPPPARNSERRRKGKTLLKTSSRGIVYDDERTRDAAYRARPSISERSSSTRSRPTGSRASSNACRTTSASWTCASADAFRREHILGAQNIPAADIVRRLADLPKNRTIVTYCWDMTCALAPKAALELAQKGFKTQFLAGGIAEWKKKGYR